MKIINDEIMEFVYEIVPERDGNNNIIQYKPYDKDDILSGRKFLEYGEGPFCKFNNLQDYEGNHVYAILIDENVVYIGQTINLTRVLREYSNISRRGCFKGGNATYCRINSNILRAALENKKVYLYAYRTDELTKYKKLMISRYNPILNSKG